MGYYYPQQESRASSWASVGMIIGIILVSIYFLNMFVSSMNTVFTNMTSLMNSLNLPNVQYSDSYTTILNNTANNLQGAYSSIEPYITNQYFIIFLIGLGLIVASLSEYYVASR